ncbi:MAG: FAD-binding oxidoreductase [Dehalococcoidia bacterium]|nr:FAD-binding oxidoreductase [Dehalococcoidia bacterium]
MQPRIDVIASLFSGLGETPTRTAPYTVDGTAPRAVVIPKNVPTLQEALKIAKANNLGVLPRGGGTMMGIGNRPTRTDLVLCTKNLDTLVEYEPADMTVTAQAGISMKRLRETLADHSQFLPLDVPLPDRATLGGVLAANIAGAHREAYGTARDWVIGIKMAHADGSLTKAGGKVVKNVTGYEMTKLYVGSLGTLGVITEATLKVLPIPAVRRTLVARFPSMADACSAAMEIHRAGIGTLACVAVDIGARPRIKAQMPVLTLDDALLLVEIGGRKAAVERRQSDLVSLLRNQFSVPCDLVASDTTALWQSLTDMGWSTENSPVFSMRLLNTPTAVVEMYPQIREALRLESFTVGSIMQASIGVLRVVAWPQPGTAIAPKDMADWVTAFRAAAARTGGHIIVEQCSPQIKQALAVWGEPPESISVMRRIKEQFDPTGILNPGRFVGGI